MRSRSAAGRSAMRSATESRSAEWIGIRRRLLDGLAGADRLEQSRRDAVRALGEAAAEVLDLHRTAVRAGELVALGAAPLPREAPLEEREHRGGRRGHGLLQVTDRDDLALALGALHGVQQLQEWTLGLGDVEVVLAPGRRDASARQPAVPRA